MLHVSRSVPPLRKMHVECGLYGTCRHKYPRPPPLVKTYSDPKGGSGAEERLEPVRLLREVRPLEHRRSVAGEFRRFRPRQKQGEIPAREPLTHLVQEVEGVAESALGRRGLSLCFQRLTGQVARL